MSSNIEIESGCIPEFVCFHCKKYTLTGIEARRCKDKHSDYLFLASQLEKAAQEQISSQISYDIAIFKADWNSSKLYMKDIEEFQGPLINSQDFQKIFLKTIPTKNVRIDSQDTSIEINFPLRKKICQKIESDCIQLVEKLKSLVEQLKNFKDQKISISKKEHSQSIQSLYFQPNPIKKQISKEKNTNNLSNSKPPSKIKENNQDFFIPQLQQNQEEIDNCSSNEQDTHNSEYQESTQINNSHSSQQQENTQTLYQQQTPIYQQKINVSQQLLNNQYQQKQQQQLNYQIYSQFHLSNQFQVLAKEYQLPSAQQTSLQINNKNQTQVSSTQQSGRKQEYTQFQNAINQWSVESFKNLPPLVQEQEIDQNYVQQKLQEFQQQNKLSLKEKANTEFKNKKSQDSIKKETEKLSMKSQSQSESKSQCEAYMIQQGEDRSSNMQNEQQKRDEQWNYQDFVEDTSMNLFAEQESLNIFDNDIDANQICCQSNRSISSLMSDNQKNNEEIFKKENGQNNFQQDNDQKLYDEMIIFHQKEMTVIFSSTKKQVTIYRSQSNLNLNMESISLLATLDQIQNVNNAKVKTINNQFFLFALHQQGNLSIYEIQLEIPLILIHDLPHHRQFNLLKEYQIKWSSFTCQKMNNDSLIISGLTLQKVYQLWQFSFESGLELIEEINMQQFLPSEKVFEFIDCFWENEKQIYSALIEGTNDMILVKKDQNKKMEVVKYPLIFINNESVFSSKISCFLLNSDDILWLYENHLVFQLKSQQKIIIPMDQFTNTFKLIKFQGVTINYLKKKSLSTSIEMLCLFLELDCKSQAIVLFNQGISWEFYRYPAPIQYILKKQSLEK